MFKNLVNQQVELRITEDLPVSRLTPEELDVLRQLNRSGFGITLQLTDSPEALIWKARCKLISNLYRRLPRI